MNKYYLSNTTKMAIIVTFSRLNVAVIFVIMILEKLNTSFAELFYDVFSKGSVFSVYFN